ncbi:MAG: hypothetical protein KKC46_17495 [Proteobacteria bacterium]|nr:hypothetical protein [Pseudomonadota bacterium]
MEYSTYIVRTASDVLEIKQSILDKLICIQSHFAPVASKNDYYLAVAYLIRDKILVPLARTARIYYQKDSRTIYCHDILTMEMNYI